MSEQYDVRFESTVHLVLLNCEIESAPLMNLSYRFFGSETNRKQIVQIRVRSECAMQIFVIGSFQLWISSSGDQKQWKWRVALCAYALSIAAICWGFQGIPIRQDCSQASALSNRLCEAWIYFNCLTVETVKLHKNAKPAEKVKGIPYSNLKIGVTKEKWVNEKR